MVVPVPVLPAEYFCLQHGGEGFTVEELVPEPAVKALAAGILPRAARLDVERFEPVPRDPVLHRQSHEFRPVVAADISGTPPCASTATSRMRITSLLSIHRSTSSATNSRLNSSQIGSHLSRRPSSV